MTAELMHIPEEEKIYTSAPKRRERKGYSWRCVRKVSGKRSGSCDFVEWLTPLLISKGFKRCALEACIFVHPTLDLVYVIHADDFLAAGGASPQPQILVNLSKDMVSISASRWPRRGHLANCQHFLSCERPRSGNAMLPKVSRRYFHEAAELLGPSGAKAAATPCLTDRKKRSPGTDNDSELTVNENGLVRSVVGKLLWEQEDYAEASYDIRESARQMTIPRQSGLARVKHLVRHLVGHPGAVLRIQRMQGETDAHTDVDSD